MVCSITTTLYKRIGEQNKWLKGPTQQIRSLKRKIYAMAYRKIFGESFSRLMARDAKCHKIGVCSHLHFQTYIYVYDREPLMLDIIGICVMIVVELVVISFRTRITRDLRHSRGQDRHAGGDVFKSISWLSGFWLLLLSSSSSSSSLYTTIAVDIDDDSSNKIFY
jgi:hypothetical protein